MSHTVCERFRLRPCCPLVWWQALLSPREPVILGRPPMQLTPASSPTSPDPATHLWTKPLSPAKFRASQQVGLGAKTHQA